MAEKKLQLLITGDAKGAQKALGALERSAGKAGKRTESALSGIAGRMADIGVAAAAFASFSAFDEAQKVAKQTEAVIASTGGVANVTAKDIGQLADSLSKKAAVDDEVIQSGANLLATFTRVRNEAGKGNDIFNQATEAALDLSVAMGKDMQSSVTMVGKALNDPVKGLTALNKAGVQFTAQQKDQVRALAESGDMLGAQKIILKELETQFGGSAEAQATSLGRAKVAVENLAESVGGVLAPALEKGADLASGAAEAFGELGAGAQQAVVGGAALGYAALRWGPQLWDAGKAAKAAAGNVVAFGQLAAEAVRTRADGVSRFAAAFDTVSVAAPNATSKTKALVSAMGGLSVAGPAVAAGVGLIGFALAEYVGESRRAKANTDALQKSMQDGASAVEAFDEKLAKTLSDVEGGFEMSTSGDKFRGYIDDLGLSMSEVSDIARMSKDEFQAWHNEMVNNGGISREFAVNMRGINDSYNDAVKNQKAYTVAQRMLNTEQEVGSGITTQYAANIDAGAEAASRYEDAQRGATDALKAFYDQTTEALSGAIGAEAALDAFTESVAENGRTLDINTEAGRDNMSALISMKDAAVDAAIAVKDQGGTNKQAAATLQGYSARLAQAARDAGYTEGEVRALIARMKLTPKDIQTRFHNDAPQEGSKVAGYIGTIGRVPGYKQTTFDANISPALQKLAALQQASINLGSGSMWAFSGRAKGGPVSAGQPYVVGEQGPEIVVPKSDGMVLTATQTKQIMSNGGSGVGGGSGVTVVVNVAGSIRSDKEVAAVVRNELIDMGRRTGRPVLAGLA